MDKHESNLKMWEEMVCCMKREMQAQDEIILAQKDQIRHLEKQVSQLEEEKKKLMDAGNRLSKQCAQLDDMCMRQQQLIEEFRGIFSKLP